MRFLRNVFSVNALLFVERPQEKHVIKKKITALSLFSLNYGTVL